MWLDSFGCHTHFWKIVQILLVHPVFIFTWIEIKAIQVFLIIDCNLHMDYFKVKCNILPQILEIVFTKLYDVMALYLFNIENILASVKILLLNLKTKLWKLIAETFSKMLYYMELTTNTVLWMLSSVIRTVHVHTYTWWINNFYCIYNNSVVKTSSDHGNK